MRDIFGSALRVIAYVGRWPHATPPNQGSAARDCVNRLFGDSDTKEAIAKKTDQLKRYGSEIRVTEEEMHACLSILSKPWFKRCWVVQEILVAKEVDLWYDVSLSMLKFYHRRNPCQGLIGFSSQEQSTLPLLYDLMRFVGKTMPNSRGCIRLYSTVASFSSVGFSAVLPRKLL